MQKTIRNRTMFCRDNIEILRGIDSNSINLVYLDPPFNKSKNFYAPMGSASAGTSFKDTWGMADIKDEWHGLIAETHPSLYRFFDGMSHVGDKSNKYYLIYMGIRLLEIHRILNVHGSMYLHIDSTMSHYLKLLCDTIFGQKSFKNEIIWHYNTPGKVRSTFLKKHDTILFYTKSNSYYFNGKACGVPREKGTVHLQHGIDRNRREYYEDYSPKKNAEQYRWYFDEGIMPPDVWNDIKAINPKADERLGYPTQKPIALLDRIIKAGSKAGDTVLDPFCGCATACLSAELHHRQWIGIDVSEMAFHLLKKRMNIEIENNIDSNNGRNIKAIFRDDIPERTDAIKSPIKKTEIKHALYGKQEGKCNGCGHHFEYRHFEIDHIIPQNKGGADSVENLQLLCGHCNKIKSDDDMALLKKKLKKMGIV